MYKIKADGHNPMFSNDTKDIYDIIIGITGDVDEAEKACAIVGLMQWGDVYKTLSFSIECFNETKEENTENTEYTRHYYVVYSFINSKWLEVGSFIGKASIMVDYQKDIDTFEDILKIKEVIEKDMGSTDVVIESWTELKEEL